jgi:hypothetical protein
VEQPNDPPSFAPAECCAYPSNDVVVAYATSANCARDGTIIRSSRQLLLKPGRGLGAGDILERRKERRSGANALDHVTL